MNRIYRLVWNRALRVWQVASELTVQRQAIAPGGSEASIFAWSRRPLVLALALAMPWLSSTVQAACTPANPTAGATVTCSGAANPLAPSYSSAANNLTVNANSGSSIGVLLGLGGTALTLTGNNTTLNNSGTIDPSLLGLLSLLSSGTFVGNSNASTLTVNNTATGVMNGTSGLLGLNLSGLTGMALTAQNGTGGVSNIRNDGSIGGNALLGVSLVPADIPVIAAYGGAQVNFVNTGTINGRVAFEASKTPGVGNTFANAGTINGGVSMGINSTNLFTVVSGSAVNLAGGVGLSLNVIGLVGVTLGFAPTGVVDGGAGGNNTLVLQNVLPSAGTGSGTGGALTNVSSSTYINFQHLIVNSGTWSLLGPLVSGDATLNGGLVNFNDGGVFGSSAVSANGGAIAASTGGLTLGNNFTLGTGGLITAGTNNFTLSGVLSGTGGLTQSGSGIVTLTAANTYTGATTISAGTLALGTTGSLLSTGAVNLSGASGVFDISGTAAGTTIGTLTGVAGSQVALGARVLTVGDATNTSFLGNITGSGGLIKQGTGTLTLGAANTFTGGTTINAGTLALSGGGSLAPTGAVTLGAGTALDISGALANQTIGNLIGASGSQILLGARTLTAGNAASTLFSGVISGTGGLVKQGSGTLTLAGANTYSGGTTINAGMLQGDTTSLQGNITDNATLVFNQATDGTFAGVVSGTGILNKQGAGTLTLSGANTYSGGTVISAGTLQGDATSLQGNIANNAALIFNQAAAGTFAGNISGAGTLNKTGAGTLTLSGTNTYTGGTTISAGTLQGTTASLTGPIVNNAILSFNQATNGTYGGVISGSGSLVKLGTGVVSLTGANTYTGGTTVTAGTLQGDTTSLQGNIVDNATLVFNQATDGTYAGVVSGSGTLVKGGAGTLTLGGINTYTGNTAINGGALQINSGSIVGNIANDAALIFNQAVDGTFAGAISGSGTLTKTGAGTLTLSGANAYSGGTTISAGALQGDSTSLQGDIVDNAALIFQQGADGTFNGAISGSGNLTKNGAGTLILNGTNSYAGGTTINAGALQGDSGSLQGNIVDNASLIFNQGSDGTFNGSVSGSGSLTKTGTGTLTLNGANTYSGGTTISAGTLQGDTTSLQGDIVDNAALSFDQASNGTYAGVISGTGDVAKNGAGTLTLSGVQSYTGATQVNAGTLALAAGASIAASSGISLSTGATFDLSAAGNQTIGGLGGTGGTVDIGGNVLTLDGTGSGTFGGTLVGSGALVKQGTGTQTLTGANLYTGGTTVDSGTLAIGAGGSLAAGSPVAINGGTLDLSAAGNQFIANLSGSGGQVQLGGGSALTVDSGSFAGVIGGAGGLTKAGVGNLVLDGSNTYSGPTQVTAGGLIVGSDAAHGTASVQSDITVASTGSLGGFGHVDGNVNVLAGGHLSPGAPPGTFTVNGDVTLALGSVMDFTGGAPGPDFNTPGAGHNVQVNGNLNLNGATVNPIDAGGFGPGLYNLFDYTGTLTQSNGGLTAPTGFAIQNLTGSKQVNLINAVGIDLNIWNANGLASPTQMGGGSGVWSQVNTNWTDAIGSVTAGRSPADAFVIFGGAAGTVTVDDAGGSQPVTTQGIQFASDGYHLNGDALGLVAPSVGAPSEIRVGDGSAGSASWVATIDNVLTGNSLEKTGAGTLVLTGANTYAQGTQLIAGTLSVSSDANLGDAAGGIDFEGGTLQITGTAYTGTARDITLGTAGGSFDIADAANTFTVGQALTGTGSLTKLGDGTLVLTGANTYSGGTTIGAGTLQGDTTSLQGNMTDNGVLDFNQGTNGTFAGTISGTGSVSKDGVGTLTLTGANTYSGGTTINAGTLQGDTTSLQGDVTDNGVLAFNQGTNGTFTGTISGTGSVSKDGAGTLTLTGANTYSGGTTINAGTLQGDTSSLQGNVTDNGVLAFNQGVDGTFTGAISGTGSVVKNGAGTLTLDGANTYSGGTTVSTGALQGDATSLQGDIVDNASVIFNQIPDGTYAGAISGTGNLIKDGGGTLILTGNNTYTGGTTISAGALQVGAGNIVGNIVDNATLVFDQAGNGSYGGVISGSGVVVKQGAGTLTLTASNSYTGATLIDSGTLALGAGSSIAASAGIGLAAGTTLDLSAAGNQSVGLLNGAGGTVDLGGNTLTISGSGNGSFAGSIIGSGALIKDGASTQTLTGANLYTGGTTINDGTLVLGAGGSLAAGSALTVNGNGVLDVSAAGNQTIASLGGSGGQVQIGGTTLTVGAGNYSGVIAGTGGLDKTGSGSLTLNGVNTYTGLTQVTAGSLIVGGDAAHASASVQSDITVANTGTLGGFGQVNGNVDVLSGGHLAPGNPVGTFAINGNLVAEQGSQLDFSFGAPGPNVNTPGQGHNVQVNGDLTLNGAVLNPFDAGGFGPGLYNLFNYTGSLTQANGGIVPPAGGYTIQYLTGSKQVNLITTAGMDLNFWNANGLASSTQLGGGSGVWSQPNANWTDATGSITAARQPVNSFVIFGGASGTVTVDDAGGTQPVTTLGIQFASDGYHLNGDMLTLVGTVGSPLTELRVGDGSAGSAGWTATIDNVLSGAGINKTGLGTLVLNGVNTYTQATELSAGTLSVSSDANLGAASAGLDFEGGTLQVTGTAFNGTARAVNLNAGGGGFDIADAGNTFTLSSAISGSGGLTKLGDGTLVLSGANTYAGGTTIAAGTLQGDSTSLQGNIADNAALVFDQNANGTFTGAISGSGSVTKQGTGTLILNGTNSYSGGTTISAGALQGDSASLQGAIVDNAALIFQQNTDGTFNGAISGSGSLTKQGGGMLTLSGANSYSGGTTVAAGTLAGNTASLQGDIVDNAVLAFNQGSDGTFAGAISGTGSLVKQGVATLTLTGANSYSGGTTISAGTLQGSTASLQGSIVDNATLAFDQASDGTFAGAISGIGSLVKLGAGTLILSGTNSYAGGTTISAGVLQGDSASLQGNIADNAALVFDQGGNGTFAGVISGSGTVTKQGAGTLILSGANTYSGGTMITAGTLQGDSNSLSGAITDNAALVFAQNSDGTFAGSINGSGTLTKQGSGSLALTGTNPLTGATSVQAGTLIVGDAAHADASLASQVTVAAGATLGGVGSIGGLDLFGTIAPSSLTDPLNVQGNAVFHNGSTYQVGANADGQNTALAVGGTVTIQGGSVLAITQPGNYKPQTQYTIITGAQGVSGQFTGVQASLTFLTPTLSYTANAVNLSLQRNAVNFVDVALTPNEKNTATGLDGLNFDSPVYTALTLLDPVSARHAFDQLSGEVHASTQTALFDGSQQIRGAVNQHLLGFGYGGQTLQGETGEGVSVWTTAWGHWDDHDANFNTSQMKSNGTGLVVGADLPLDQGRLGVLLARGQDSTRVDSLASDTRTRSTYAGIYGGSEWGAFHLRGAAVYAWQDIRGHRFISFPGYWQAANSDYDAHTAQAYLEGSYVIPLGQFTTLEPYAQLARVQVHTDGFREQGGAADLSIDGATTNQTLGTLGLRGSMTLGDSGLRGFAGLGWQHAWGDTNPSRNQRFVAGGPDFTIQGTAVASNAGVVELGLRMPLGRSAWLDAGYFGQFAGHANDQSARVTFTMSF